jgi:acetyltransferase-like isoleucine patch superfamily enzyme
MSVFIERPAQLILGYNSGGADLTVGAFSYSYSLITPFVTRIGRYCSIGSLVGFGDMEHEPQWLTTSNISYQPDFWSGVGWKTHPLPPAKKRGGIEIGNDVWIGAQSYIRGGAKIGDGAVIGHSAVVTKDVPPYSIAVGNPARVVKSRFDGRTQQRLLATRWWDLAPDVLKLLDLADIEGCLSALEGLKDRQAWAPETVEMPPQGPAWELREGKFAPPDWLTIHTENDRLSGQSHPLSVRNHEIMDELRAVRGTHAL